VGLKWSRFNIRVPLSTGEAASELMFNTLTRNLVTAGTGALRAVDMHIREDGHSQVAPPEALEKLRGLGFLVSADRDEASYLRYALGRWKYGNRATLIFIAFTSACNFRCSYCYQDYRTSDGRSLSDDGWDALFRFVRSRALSDPACALGVALFGGEPLLNPALLRRAVTDLKKLESSGRQVPIALITNGSLLNRSVRDLVELLDRVQVTLDGPRHIHNLRRPYADDRGTYDDIIRGLEETIDILKGTLVIRINVNTDSVRFVPELLRTLESLGLKRPSVELDIAGEYSSQSEIVRLGCDSKLTAALRSEIAELLLHVAQAGWKLNKNFVVGPCTFCQANSFAVDEDLKVYKCPGFLYQRPDGHIDGNGELKILESRWYQAVVFEPQCVTSCTYAPICYGGCRWMGGGPTTTKCNLEVFSASIQTFLKAYALSRYSKDLPCLTTAASSQCT